jgi:hypothetical protein
LEAIFENKIILSKEVIAECAERNYKVFGKKYRMFVLLMFIISVISALAALIIDRLIGVSAFFLLFAIFFLFVFYKGHLIKLNDTYKNLKGLHGELPENIIKFYEDKFETSTSRSNLKIEYSKVTKITETRNLYLLFIEKQAVMISKTGFTGGESYKFKSFILEKCKNVNSLII